MKKAIIITFVLFAQLQAFSCTIISAKDKKGQVWTGNNEDNLFTFKSLINIVPANDGNYGYVFFTYNNPKQGMQGGVNEAGLFFDFNGVEYTESKANEKKEYYPGGHVKMFEYILEHFSTVQEVMDLYRKYRIPGIEHSQLHLADKFGNLGIIVADSMWITKDNHLASTNYNLCHGDLEDDPCFRMPIAQRLLKNNEPSFELFTQICDSTHQFYSSGASTIYSNIHNLSTGEIWFYFGLDFKNAYKTSVRELLKRGKTSIYLCDLFKDQILVRAHMAAENKDFEKSIELMESIQDPAQRLTLMRLLVTGLIDMEANIDSYPVFEHFFRQIKPEPKDYYVNSFALYCRGQKEKANETLIEGLRNYPGEETLIGFKDQLEGKFPPGKNYRLELADFKDATYVLIDGLSYYQFENLLVKVGDKWVGEYPLEPDEYFFRFNVDGKIVTSQQFEVVTYDEEPHNRLVIH
ncbi:carcinine hydrolase/isopenicillin-N N-acyltransferase family protein [uncultured Fluviicola sp.]|uniref:carcinine hydrolase/isopenicillin-N N-acyltransferase family protein n=1 Tax=uncultured Fluviicola sp. TaxID=463303 RepID=UPI0025E6B0B5|nr:carcinine hydrolase/isopenicillin-N N-acyltransferase family protein [uncultured Fluviicola sp.]